MEFNWNDRGKAIPFLLRKDQNKDNIRGENTMKKEQTMITNV